MGEPTSHAGWVVADGGTLLGSGGAFIIGVPWPDAVGQVEIFSSLASGELGAEDAAATLVGEEEGGCDGESLANAGDVDGDGVDDLIVGGGGACWDGSGPGTAWVVRGPLAGRASLADAEQRFVGPTDTARLGWALAAPGDVDGDGLADVVLAASGIELAADAFGIVYVVTAAPLDSLTDAPIQLMASSGDYGVTALSGAGDVDRDGRADLLIGMESRGGAVYLTAGLSTGAWDLGTEASFLTAPPGEEDWGGVLAGGSDIDGDGAPDIAVAGGGQWYSTEAPAGRVALASVDGWF